MARLFSLLVLIGMFSCRAMGDEMENPYKYSQYYKDLAKEINSDPHVLWWAHDPDMTVEELEARKQVIQQRIEVASKTSPRHKAFDILEAAGQLPDEWKDQASPVDWYLTKPQWLRAVGDQGQCGSCWAYSTVHTLNDLKNIKSSGSDLTPLSIQEVLTCCTGEGCGGCDGGYLQSSYQYMAKYGTPSESCKPYSDYPGRCSQQCRNGLSSYDETRYGPSSYTPVFAQGYSQVISALANGPASGSLMVYDDLMTYRGGIYTHTRGSLQGGHAIEIVGASGSGAGSYWRVKNSWGPSWGEGGFFRVTVGSNVCNFESMERGFASGVKTLAGTSKTRKFNLLDDTDPIDNSQPAGDETNQAGDEDPAVMEAAMFAAAQLNPIHCAGNVTLDAVLQAERQVVSGTKFYLVLSVNAPSCERGPEVYFAQVYMTISGEYNLQGSYALGPTASSFYAGGSMAGVDSSWKTVGIAFIVLAVVLLLAIMYLCCRGKPKQTAEGEQSTSYRQINDQL